MLFTEPEQSGGVITAVENYALHWTRTVRWSHYCSGELCSSLNQNSQVESLLQWRIMLFTEPEQSGGVITAVENYALHWTRTVRWSHYCSGELFSSLSQNSQVESLQQWRIMLFSEPGQSGGIISSGELFSSLSQNSQLTSLTVEDLALHLP